MALLTCPSLWMRWLAFFVASFTPGAFGASSTYSSAYVVRQQVADDIRWNHFWLCLTKVTVPAQDSVNEAPRGTVVV
jgi:hypothetical protein